MHTKLVNYCFPIFCYMLFVLSFSLIKAQENPSVPATCGNDEIYQIIDPTGEKLEEYAEKVKIQMKKMRVDGKRSAGGKDTIKIPFIIHVIHQGEMEGQHTNVSDRQLREMISGINIRLNGANADSSLILPPFKGDFTSAAIQLVPVVADKKGNNLSEPGVHRIRYHTLGVSGPPFTKSVMQKIQEQVYWDPYKYVNIYVANIDDDIAGYATLPETTYDEYDAVVIDYKHARIESTTPVHEMGHFFGLLHVWGREEGCSNDDWLDDTPLQDAPTIYFEEGKSSCGSKDMIRNYMDYTSAIKEPLQYYTARVMFTRDQCDYMRYVIKNFERRKTLTDHLSLSTANLNTIPVSGVTYAKTNRPYIYSADVQYAYDDITFEITPDSQATIIDYNDKTAKIEYHQPGMYDLILTVLTSEGEEITSHHNNHVMAYEELTCNSVQSHFEPYHNHSVQGYSGPLIGWNDRKDISKANYVETDTSGKYVKSLYIREVISRDFALADKELLLRIWEVDTTTGGPGKIIGEKAIPLDDLWYVSKWYEIPFDEPVQVPKQYFAGFSMVDYSGYDELVISSSAKGKFPNKGAWEQLADSTWQQIPEGVSISMRYVYTEKPEFQLEVPDTTCQGAPVNLAVSEFSNASDFKWHVDGLLVDTNVMEIEHTFSSKGKHTLTVWASNGCYGWRSDSIVKEIMVVDPPKAKFEMTALAQCKKEVGMARLNYQSGKKPFSYRWEVGEKKGSGSILNNLPAGKLTYTVLDGYGCEMEYQKYLPQVPSIKADYDVNHVNCEYGRKGSINANVSSANPPMQFRWSSGHERSYLGDLVGGSYMVTITDAAGCYLTDTVMVPNYPSSISLPTDQEVCKGEIATVKVYGANEVNWDHGPTDPILIYKADSSKTFSGSISEGRYCYQPFDVGIDVLLESFKITSGDSLVACMGATVELATVPDKAEVIGWNNGDNGSEMSFTALETGYLIATAQRDQCTASDSMWLSIKFCDTTAPAYSLELFPNPASSKLYYILNNEAAKPLHLEMYNMAGQRVYARQLPATQWLYHSIPVSSLPNGVYQLRVISADATLANRPVVISRP